jgi:hypothetical protein
MTSQTKRTKAPPASLETEKALLGSILLDNDILIATVENLTPAEFYSERHRLIFETMAKMAQAGDSIEPVTITVHLQESGRLEQAGGAAYISSLTDGVPVGTDAAIPQYIKIIKDRSRQRQTLKSGYELAQEIAAGAPANEIAAHAKRISEIAAPVIASKRSAVVSDHDYPICPKTAFYGLAEPYRLAFSQSTNASDNYHLAGFLTMAGVLLGKSILTQEGGDDIYPNLYTVVVGKAGFARKDSANNRAIKFLRAVDPDVAIVETIGSIEQFIGYCQNRQKELIKGGFDGPFRIVLRFRELQGLIAKAGQKATGNIWSKLCELYDCPPELTTAVKNDNAIVLQPVGAMQAATCPEWLKDMTRRDLEAGPGRRIIWVPGDPKPRIKRRQPADQRFLSPVIRAVKDRMDDYRMRQEATVIPMDPDVTDFLDEWADKHESRSSGNDLIDTLTAGDEVAVRKVALIHAALDGARTINLLHLQAAIAFVEFLFESRFPIFSEHGLTPMGEIESKILKKVHESMPAGISWRELRRYQGRIGIEDFKRVLNGLTTGADPDLKIEKRFGRAWVLEQE